MTEILSTLIVGLVCISIGWIIGYWNGARGTAQRWHHQLPDPESDD